MGPEREVADQDSSVVITTTLRGGGLRNCFWISGSKGSKSALGSTQLILKGYTGAPVPGRKAARRWSSPLALPRYEVENEWN